MDDASTTLAELHAVVDEFVDQRDWQQFHAPKNLAMALAIEVAELMEHFQWIDGPASRRVADDAAKRGEVADELADVLCYTLAIAGELGIDLSAALESKMVKNRQKYPADEYRGRYGPEDDGNA
jgi:NTP pyrophosphatase (non-canonical NTP hydrolase)